MTVAAALLPRAGESHLGRWIWSLTTARWVGAAPVVAALGEHWLTRCCSCGQHSSRVQDGINLSFRTVRRRACVDMKWMHVVRVGWLLTHTTRLRSPPPQLGVKDSNSRDGTTPADHPTRNVWAARPLVS